MQPQLLPPNVVPHLYAGGPALAAWRGLSPVGDRSPEEWVGATIARLDPVIRLKRVDFPTFGLPTSTAEAGFLDMFKCSLALPLTV